jgi:hypothetical protein
LFFIVFSNTFPSSFFPKYTIQVWYQKKKSILF